MKRSLAVLLVVVAMPAIATTTSSLKFSVPNGWVDLSPGAPAVDAGALQPELAKSLREHSKGMVLVAIDPGQQRGLLTTVNATIAFDKPARVTEALLTSILTELEKQPPGLDFNVREKGIIQVGDISVGRYVEDFSVEEGSTTAQLVYLLPSKEGIYVLTYSTTKEHLAQVLPAFDAIAQSTTGLWQPAEDEGVNLGRRAANWLSGSSNKTVALATALALILGFGISALRQRQRDQELWRAIEGRLKRGPCSVPEIAAAAGLTGLAGRGKVMHLLQDLKKKGLVEHVSAPEGTPRGDRFNLEKYKLPDRVV